MSTLPTLSAILHVAAGGAAGAVLRYQTGRWMTGWLGAPAMGVFPWATLAVNAIGSVLMGLLAGWLVRSGANAAGGSGENLRLLLGVGLLGGFTTFSAFSLEMVLLIERGQFTIAALYAILSFSLGISGLLFGLTFMRAVT
ncbi:CrcB family protein [Qipengyuania sp. DSG2-2]|uniref:CrcB family protein n=1 Tax=Qipengyuania sp. DGS2-2 TaxID=3349631 RepID=UPI0036D3064E